jgi:hypothetical protein
MESSYPQIAQIAQKKQIGMLEYANNWNNGMME